jgi:hypothetical protein
MTTETTPAGADILVLDDEEVAAFLDDEVRRLSGLESVDALMRALAAGELNDADPAIGELLVLLGLGRNGH